MEQRNQMLVAVLHLAHLSHKREVSHPVPRIVRYHLPSAHHPKSKYGVPFTLTLRENSMQTCVRDRTRLGVPLQCLPDTAERAAPRSTAYEAARVLDSVESSPSTRCTVHCHCPRPQCASRQGGCEACERLASKVLHSLPITRSRSPSSHNERCSSPHAAPAPHHPLARLRQAPLFIDMTPPVRVRLVDRRPLEATLYTPQRPALPRALLDILPPNRQGLRGDRPRVCIATPRYAPLH